MRVGFVLQAAFASSAKNIRYAVSASSYSFSGVTMALGEKMQVKKLSDNAIMPVRGSEHAAGFDLARCVSVVVWMGVQLLGHFQTSKRRGNTPIVSFGRARSWLWSHGDTLNHACLHSMRGARRSSGFTRERSVMFKNKCRYSYFKF